MYIKIINAIGTRPNFVKIAPILKALDSNPLFCSLLVHTGQHYDDNMSNIFFDYLGIPKPNMYLGVCSGAQSEQTARIMCKFEKVLLNEKPSVVLVVGDCNTTLGCALAAAKLNIPVAHVEAGLRSFNREMPEEINRILTDHVSSLLFTTEKSANENLLKEGIPKEKIFFVGNVMIDTLLAQKEKAKQSRILSELKLKEKQYAVLTLHRVENVDKKQILSEILDAIFELQFKIKIIFPVHPRTRNRIKQFGLQDKIKKAENLLITDPLGYLDFLNLITNSMFVLTDSGGIQEETTILDVQCLTLRNETERPITVERGTNRIVGMGKQEIIRYSSKILNNDLKKGEKPPLWDGKAAQRIIQILATKNDVFGLDLRKNDGGFDYSR